MHEITILTTSGLHQLNSVPNGAWAVILASPILSGIVQGLKHWLQIEGDKRYKFLGINFRGENVMLLVLTAVGFLASVGYYLMQTNPRDPRVLAIQTAVLGFTTQPFYYSFIKPLYARLNTDLQLQNLGKQELQTAAIPAEGLPVTGRVVSTTATPRQQFENSISMENFDL